MSDDEGGRAAAAERRAAYYLDKIKDAQTTGDAVKWQERCKIVRDRYRYEDSRKSERRYQLFWSNLEILKPAVYSKPPVPVVQRRFRDSDPVGRATCEILERACRFQTETNDFSSRLESVRDDYLLYARGVARVMYEPVFDATPENDDEDGLDEEAMRGPQAAAAEEAAEGGEILDFEHVKVRYVHRLDFVHEPARNWDEVGWVAFRAFLDKDALTRRFGEEIADRIPLGQSKDREREGGEANLSDDAEKATIWEFWDRNENRVVWVAKGFDKVLEAGEPYLKLSGFFPCPRPAFGTITPDSLVPVPDYTYYQDQCEEIDTLTRRMGALQQSLKLVGFYPAGPTGEAFPEIEKAVQAGFENKMIAVPSWAAFAQGSKNGVPVVFLPVEQVASILKECIALRQAIIQDVYQIIGISDIMRGDAKASETATAQSIKAQFGSVRIRERQSELARFARDIVRLVAEIISTQFQPETLLKMANMQLPTRAELAMQQLQQQLAMQAQQQAAMQQQAMQPPPGPPMPAPAAP